MVCAYCATPKERVFHCLEYSNIEAIQGILRFYSKFKTMATNDMNAELISIITDIEEAIQKIEITEKQERVVTFYIEGWTEEQIGKMMDTPISQQAVSKLIMKVCKKLSRFLVAGEQRERNQGNIIGRICKGSGLI